MSVWPQNCTECTKKGHLQDFVWLGFESSRGSFSSFDHGQSLDAELNQLEDTFRNPNPTNPIN